MADGQSHRSPGALVRGSVDLPNEATVGRAGAAAMIRRWSSHAASVGDWREDDEGAWVLFDDVRDLLGHQHEWRPVELEKWITLPTLRVVALCGCGETRRFAVEDDR